MQAFIKLGDLASALRVARKHCPQLAQDLSLGMQKLEANPSALGASEFLKQLKMWEDAREWNKALDFCLEASDKQFPDARDLEGLWERAIQTSYNFV